MKRVYSTCNLFQPVLQGLDFHDRFHVSLFVFSLKGAEVDSCPRLFLSKYYKRGWLSYFLFVFIGFRSSWQFSRYSSSWYWSTEITAGKLLVYINLICNNRYRLLTRSYKPFGHSWIVWYTYTLSFRLRKQQTLSNVTTGFPMKSGWGMSTEISILMICH